MSGVKLTKAQVKLAARNPDVARLIAKAETGVDGCWTWNGSLNGKGYGQFAFRGKTWKAHRASYTLFCGEIPDGILVCHHCDNPSCVNPHHLFLGHATTNMQDMSRKGRSRNAITSQQSHFIAGRAPRGEETFSHKLTEKSAADILARAAGGELTSVLAEEFRISRFTVQALLRGETWKHLPRPTGLPRRVGAYSRRSAGRLALSQGGGDEA